MINFKIDKNFLISFSSTLILACIGLMTASTPITMTYALGTTVVSSLYILGGIGAYHAGGWLWENAPQALGRFFNKLFQKPEVKPEPEAMPELEVKPELEIKPEPERKLEPEDSPIAAFQDDDSEPDSPMGSFQDDFDVDLGPAENEVSDPLSLVVPDTPVAESVAHPIISSPVRLPDSPVLLPLVPPLALPIAPVPLPAAPAMPVAPIPLLPVLPAAPPASPPRPPVLPLFLCNIPGFRNRGSVPIYMPRIARRSARLLGY